MAKIDQFLRLMEQNKASDLHLTVGSPPVLRVNGALKRVKFRELTPQDMKTIMFEIMSAEKQLAFEQTFEVDFAYELPGSARFRVNLFMQRKGMGAVLRTIPAKILSAEELGLPDVVRTLCGLNKGLVLVTGPTGSGKSTTLAAMLDLINSTRPEHILTIEDPVEFTHPNKMGLVNQREVGGNTLSFAAALRAALREDPDVILVGEMRDLETIALGLTAAETGHLVFGTLHTSSAAKTIDRIINVFPSEEQAQMPNSRTRRETLEMVNRAAIVNAAMSTATDSQVPRLRARPAALDSEPETWSARSLAVFTVAPVSAAWISPWAADTSLALVALT